MGRTGARGRTATAGDRRTLIALEVSFAVFDAAAPDAYAQALTLTEQMLDAARKSEWDRLVQLEIVRGRILDEIREANQGPPASHEAGLQRRALIEAILEHDNKIKLLTHDWMHELRDILGSATAQRLLNKTYETL